MALFSHVSAFALTFEEYIVDHDSKDLKIYITGYVDALYDNAYLLGGCPRKLAYRPYGEFFQHIDIHVAHETQNKSKDVEKFYKKPVEPFLTSVILKYINCGNPESLKLENEKKEVQVGIRDIARIIMDDTKKYASPVERERDFQYTKYLDKLNNPRKYEVKCPACKICPSFNPTPIEEYKINANGGISVGKPVLPVQQPDVKKASTVMPFTIGKSSNSLIAKQQDAKKQDEPLAKATFTIEDTPIVPKVDPEHDANVTLEESDIQKADTNKADTGKIDIQKSETTNKSQETDATTQGLQPNNKSLANLITKADIEEAKGKVEEIKTNFGGAVSAVLPENVKESASKTALQLKTDVQNFGNSAAEKTKNIIQKADIQATVEPLNLPSKADVKNASKKTAEGTQKTMQEAKYKLEKIDINFDNLDAITLPD